MFHPRISYGGLQEDSHNAAKSRLARRATRNTPIAKPALGNGHVQGGWRRGLKFLVVFPPPACRIYERAGFKLVGTNSIWDNNRGSELLAGIQRSGGGPGGSTIGSR